MSIEDRLQDAPCPGAPVCGGRCGACAAGRHHLGHRPLQDPDERTELNCWNEQSLSQDRLCFVKTNKRTMRVSGFTVLYEYRKALVYDNKYDEPFLSGYYRLTLL